MGTGRPLLLLCGIPDTGIVEVRAVTLFNHGCRTREFELTSYAEVCLNDRKADQTHPAFAKLFLETEFDPRCGALLARRRPRSSKEQPLFGQFTPPQRAFWLTRSNTELDRLICLAMVGAGEIAPLDSDVLAVRRDPLARFSIRSSACAGA